VGGTPIHIGSCTSDFSNGYGLKKIAYPFKFNLACMCDESFGDIVRSVWCSHQGFGEEGSQRRLAMKLIKLKS
jgi:hypothetical protein